MTPERDQRKREDLELFLLALISYGIDTPYRMQSIAGISQGASIQSLRRLLARKLVSTREGPRRRRQFSLTRAGRERLAQQHSPDKSRKHSPGDFESVLRIALLAAFLDGDVATASSLLKEAAAERCGRVGRNNRGSNTIPKMVSLYAGMREARSAAISRIEADIFERIVSELKPKRRA
jgi:DNA-binding PadR family transcriptional regulator